MKKLFAILLAIAFGLSLFACNALEANNSDIKEVRITADKLKPGMTVKDVLVEVTIDNQPVPCRICLTGFVWDGYWEMAEDEPIPENFSVRIDVYYSLPKDCDLEDINVTVECDGGVYDGTGSISYDSEGNVEAWSRIFFGEEPKAPQTQPTEESTQPVEQTAQPIEQTTQPIEQTTQPIEQTTQPVEQTTQPVEQTTQPIEQTTPPHEHIWIEQPGPGILVCTIDGTKTFKCSCGETKSEIIPAPGHDLGEWSASSATCTKDGYKAATCKRCSAGFIIEMPATGHTWSAWVKKTGRVHSHTCSVCNAEEEANHNIPSGSVTCTDCGADIIN